MNTEANRSLALFGIQHKQKKKHKNSITKKIVEKKLNAPKFSHVSIKKLAAQLKLEVLA